MHVLLISPTSQLPTICNQNSLTYAELMQAGYQVSQVGTKRELMDIEQEIMENFCLELEINN